MIGIGITTTDARPYHKKYWETLVNESSLTDGMKVVFVHNAPSVAEGKNDCLRQLKDCNDIFLFDDDTYPITNGWAEWFIQHAKTSGNNHFAYLRQVHQIRRMKLEHGIGFYNNSAGCMMYLNKTVLEKVGAFDTKYKRYGFEHVNYSERCYRAGLTQARNVCPINADDYVVSLDMDAWYEVDFVHYSTLSADEMEKSVNDNYLIFQHDTFDTYLPL